MFCNKCGTPIDNSDVFCRNCGTKIRSFSDVSDDSAVQKTSMICSGCGGVLQPLNGIDSYICTICGNKVLISGMSDSAYEARVDLKKIEQEERMQTNALSHEKDVLQIQTAYQSNENRSRRNLIIVGLSFFFLVFVVPLFVYEIYPFFKVKNQRKQVKQLSEEVDSYIDDEEYEEAAKVNKDLKKRVEELNDDDWITWMDEYLENYYEITLGEREESGEKAKKLILKSDLEEIDDMDKNAVVDYLIKQGFVNISCVGRNAKYYQDHYYQVDDITIEGEDDCYSGEIFYDDAEVVIFILIH